MFPHDVFEECSHLGKWEIRDPEHDTLHSAVYVLNREHQTPSQYYSALYDKENTTIYYYNYVCTDEFVFPSTVTTIYTMAFKDCSNLRSVFTWKPDPDNENAAVAIAPYAFTNSGLTTLDFDIAFSNTDIAAGDHAFSNLQGIQSISIHKQTVIYNYMFTECNGLNSLDLTYTDAGSTTAKCDLTTIGQYAFYKVTATGLINLVFPDEVTSINNYAFSEFANLNSVSLTKKQDPTETPIGTNVFQNCPNLVSIKFAEDYTHITAYMFADCPAINEFIQPTTMANIDTYAFSNSFTADISLDTLTILADTVFGDYAFLNCTHISTINISPARTASFSVGCFEGCTSLDNVYIPTGITELNAKLFRSCKELQTFYADEGKQKKYLHDDIETIGLQCFQFCIKLEVFKVPKAIQLDDTHTTGLGDYCFSGCTNLHTFDYTKAKNIKYIPKFCFENCRDLTFTSVPDRGFQLIKDDHGNVQITEFKDYCFMGSGMDDVTLPNDFATLGAGVFKDCTSLSSFTIEVNEQGKPTITQIPAETFMGCTSLESSHGDNYLHIPKLITTLGVSAFNGCERLQEIHFEDDLTTIQDLCFANSGLVKINMSDFVTTLGAHAFENCRSLGSSEGSVILSKELTILNDYTFSGCSSLISHAIHFSGRKHGEKDIVSSIASFGAYCFAGTTNLKSMDLYDKITKDPTYREGHRLDHLTSCGSHCFYQSGLSNVDFTRLLNNYAEIDTIGDSCFEECNSLSTLKLGKAITFASEKMCKNCPSLSSVDFYVDKSASKENIATQVTEFKAQCFYLCTSLSYINTNELLFDPKIFPELTTFGPLAFAKTAITNLTLVAKVTTIGDGCFWLCPYLNGFNVPDLVGMSFIYEEGLLLSADRTRILQSFIGDECEQDCKVPAAAATMDQHSFQFNTRIVSLKWAEHTTMTDDGFAEGKTDDGLGAFLGCSSLRVATVGEHITIIKKFTYKDCTSLDDIDFPSVIHFEDGCFQGCTSLSELNIPNTTTDLQEQCFTGCINLAIVHFGGVRNVDQDTFIGAPNLAVIDGDSVRDCEIGSFENHPNLMKVDFPKISYIRMYAFLKCSALAHIDFARSDSTRYIEIFAFQEIGIQGKFIVPIKADEEVARIFWLCAGIHKFYPDTEHGTQYWSTLEGCYANTAASQQTTTALAYPMAGQKTFDLGTTDIIKFGDYCFANLQMSTLTINAKQATNIGGTLTAFYGTTATIYSPSWQALRSKSWVGAKSLTFRSMDELPARTPTPRPPTDLYTDTPTSQPTAQPTWSYITAPTSSQGNFTGNQTVKPAKYTGNGWIAVVVVSIVVFLIVVAAIILLIIGIKGRPTMGVMGGGSIPATTIIESGTATSTAATKKEQSVDLNVILL